MMSGDMEATERAGVVKEMIGSMPLLHQAVVTGMADDNVMATCPFPCSSQAVPSIKSSPVTFCLLLIFTYFVYNRTFHLDIHEWIFCSYIAYLCITEIFLLSGVTVPSRLNSN